MEPIEIREFRNRIGKAIKELRSKEGLSAKSLAKILGVTQPTISRIENGTTSIAAEKLCFLASAFNKPLSYFVGKQSSVTYDEEDILRAGLVYYGARHIRSKRTINILDYYKTYADFLNAALLEVDDSRFAAALATTLYAQALNNNLSIIRIVSTVNQKLRVANLLRLLEGIHNAYFNIRRSATEKERVKILLDDLEKNLEQRYGKDEYLAGQHSLVAEVSGSYIANFINASIGHDG